MLSSGTCVQPCFDALGDLLLALRRVATAKILPHQIYTSLMEVQRDAKALSGIVGERKHGLAIIPRTTATAADCLLVRRDGIAGARYVPRGYPRIRERMAA